MARKKQNLNPLWKVPNKEVDLGEPTSFLDHVYLGCTQRHCQTSKDTVDNYRTMFESRISAGATEKPCCGDSRVWWKHYFDDDWGCFKLCFNVSRFIPAESTCVSCWSTQCELCESCPAHQVLVFPFLLACITAQEISRVHLIPHGGGACVL